MKLKQMYGEEKVIDGVLHHRRTPDGEFIPFSAEALTTAFIAMKTAYAEAIDRENDLKDKLNSVKRTVCA